MATSEARIKQTEAGGVVASAGWFVLNLADVAWTRNERAGARDLAGVGVS